MDTCVDALVIHLFACVRLVMTVIADNIITDVRG